MLVNVVDVPPLCNFIMPAIARVGPISIAVSTRGASPALAKRLRSEIAERYGEPYAQLAEMLNDIRALGAGHAADLSGPQALLRGRSCTPSPIPSSSCARATSRPCATSSRRTCAPPRAPVRRPEGFAAFIESVAERSFGAAFPMFREADPALEHADGAARRRANATAYLDARAGRSPLLLVGEAMGYAGGRFSGHRLHGRAHAGRLGRAVRGHEPAARGLGRAVGDDRARRARDARAERRDGALERRAGAPAPARRAALEPHARRRRAARRRRGARRADRAARSRARRSPSGAAPSARSASSGLPCDARVRHPGQRRRDGVPRRALGRATCCRRADGAARGRSPSAARTCAASARARCRR